MDSLLLLLYPGTMLVVVAIVVASLWRGMRGVERIADAIERIEARTGDRRGVRTE